MRLPISFIKLIALFIFAGVALSSAPTVLAAAPNGQPGQSGQITRLEPSGSIILPTTNVKFAIDIRNNDFVEREYQLDIILISPSGQVAFNSEGKIAEDNGRSQKEVRERLTVPVGGSLNNIEVIWETNSKTEAGVYQVTAALRDFDEFGTVYHNFTALEGVTFEVQAKPLIRVSKESVDFGRISPGEVREDTILVSNSGNGTLNWSVTRWPQEWIEVIEPTSEVKESGTIRLKMKPDAPLSQPLAGDLVIESNARIVEIPLSAALNGTLDGEVLSVVAQGSPYRQGQEIEVRYDVRNIGNLPNDYRATVTIVDPQGDVVFDTNVVGEDDRIVLAPGLVSDKMIFNWTIPFASPEGMYEVYVSLRYWFDENLIFYDFLESAASGQQTGLPVNGVFEVRKGPELSVFPEEWNFGEVQEGDNSRTTIEIENIGRGTLEWNMESWPDWIEIFRPNPANSQGDTDILLGLKPDAAPGTYSDAIELVSNGGTKTVTLSVNIQGPPTPTPEPTSTPEPTATPAPTATATATPEPDTPTPRPTDTPVPPTRTPTATPVPPTATATAVPPTATPEPTSTPTAVALAQAATAAPEPEEEEQDSGGCGAPLGHISTSTSVANLLMIFAPLGMVIGMRSWRRRRF